MGGVPLKSVKPELQPSAMRNLDNPESDIHQCAVTLLTSGTQLP